METNELLDKAEHSLRTADHMIYITYPLIKENRLLKKALEQIHESILKIIEATLQYEQLFKRIKLQEEENQDQKENQKQNIRIFQNKCASRINLSREEQESLSEILEIVERYKTSPFEFIRKDKLVIMSNNLRTSSITLKQLKNYLNLIKNLLKKTKEYMARVPI